MSLIEVSDLSLAYDGEKVVNDLNLSVEKGDYLCIVGENGSGKSTFVKALLGILKPAGGEIVFDGSVSKKLGYLPQQTVVQRDFPVSVGEVIISVFVSSGGIFYTKAQKQRVCDVEDMLGIKQLHRKSYRELSGGQQQRVLLARALCATGDVIVLDEPVTGLDVEATAEMYSLIERLNKSGITVLMVSHDLDAAIKYSNKILHMSHNGYFFGSTADYLTSGYYTKLVKGK